MAVRKAKTSAKNAVPLRQPVAIYEIFDATKLQHQTLETYLEGIVQQCATWFGATGASLFLRDDQTKSFPLAVAAGADERIPNDAVVFEGLGIAGEILKIGEPQLINEAESHHLIPTKKRPNQVPIHSSLVVPLITHEREKLGVLNLSRSNGLPAFNQDDLHLAQSVGSHIALALLNGRLISKLHRAVNYSAELHRRLDTIIESLVVGIVVLRRNGTISHINREAAELAPNVEVDDSLKRLLSRLPATLTEPVQSVAQRTLAGERARAHFEDQASSTAWSIFGSPLPDGGATIALHDSTEQFNMHREMERVRRLAEIGQMTAMIAHEIRNPLSAMRGAAQVIQGDPSHAPEMASIIEDEVKKLSDLCTSFLDFARPLELNVEPVHLASVIERVATMHQLEFQAAGVTLDVQKSGESAIYFGDRPRMEQVVHNLLLNALQACTQGGRVTVCINGHQLRIHDTGVGMEQETMENLFTPFFTTKARGTGLGLSTVKKIVDAHGGTITVSSEQGAGTTFEIDWVRPE